MRRRPVAAALVAAVALALAGVREAGAQAIGGCTIQTNLGAGIRFGAYDPLAGSGVSVVWPVSFFCPLGHLGFSVGFSGGNSGNPAARWMSDALGEHLDYNIYEDAAHTVVWGDGTNGTQPYVGAASPQPHQTIDIYAFLPGGQSNVSAYQTFGDSIVVTITF